MRKLGKYAAFLFAFTVLALCATARAEGGAPAATFFPILPLGAGDEAAPQLLPVASNHPLEGDHKGIRRAVIVIHDFSRDAQGALVTVMRLAGADDAATIILAPQFLLDVDINRFAAQLPEQGKMFARWPLDGWAAGDDSIAAPAQKAISSFTALDMIMLYLDDRGSFPDMRQIVIAGNGLGGDFVQRYAALGQAPDLVASDRIDVRYVVANASSYLYFTGARFIASKEGKDAGGFGTPDRTQCANYDAYPYGLENLNPYGRRVGPGAIRVRYPQRRVIYLDGDQGRPDPFLDQSCAALMQGTTPFARTAYYSRYLTVTFGGEADKAQQFVTVTKGDTTAASMFGSACGVVALFGDGDCGPQGSPPVLSNAENPR